MLERPIITLTTDFGLKDPFVGIMKGIILGINPKAEIIDIAHNITPHNTLEASHVISIAYKYFPPTTIHVVVVDPEVGSSRRLLLIVTEDHYFIGPDNGVFSHIIEEQRESPIFKVIHITASHYFLQVNGPTFHGRDIFAPVAAWLSKGIASSKFGEQVSDHVTLPLSKARTIGENVFEGEVVHLDSFGNAITNITKNDIEKLSPGRHKEKLKVMYKDQQLNFTDYYSETGGSEISAVINSFGFLELFCYKGNASSKYGITTGDKVSVVTI